jgi:hypothetical protein
MNALTVVRFAPRREIKVKSAMGARLTCRWVKDPGSGRLVCRWLAEDPIQDEKPGPRLRVAA